MTPEAKNVQYLKRRVTEFGGRLRKISWEGRVGAPDWLVLAWGGHFFVEVKAPGEKPRKTQLREHEVLRDAGFEVHVVDCPAAIDTALVLERRRLLGIDWSD